MKLTKKGNIWIGGGNITFTPKVKKPKGKKDPLFIEVSQNCKSEIGNCKSLNGTLELTSPGSNTGWLYINETPAQVKKRITEQDKIKRARNAKGQFKPDDPATAGVNESRE